MFVSCCLMYRIDALRTGEHFQPPVCLGPKPGTLGLGKSAGLPTIVLDLHDRHVVQKTLDKLIS